jgi:hypothetical protein
MSEMSIADCLGALAEVATINHVINLANPYVMEVCGSKMFANPYDAEMDKQHDVEMDAQDEHEILSVAVGKQTTDLLCVAIIISCYVLKH